MRRKVEVGQQRRVIEVVNQVGKEEVVERKNRGESYQAEEFTFTVADA